MRIGFIGIGNMGEPMAGHLVKGGPDVTKPDVTKPDVTVFDVDATRAAVFAKAHTCQAAAKVADLAACEIIVTMLPTGNDVSNVLTKMDGGALLKAMKAGTVVIDMSSSEPVGTQCLGKALAKQNVVLIDAPVSGGVARAKSATLAIMIGTDDPPALERVRPILKLMGDRLFETGGLGSGHAMKALNNFCAAAAFAATSEAMMIGAQFGLDRAKMIEVMNVSTL
jgi:3-hydroxyisobutyrate dehydrogenase